MKFQNVNNDSGTIQRIDLDLNFFLFLSWRALLTFKIAKSTYPPSFAKLNHLLFTPGRVNSQFSFFKLNFSRRARPSSSIRLENFKWIFRAHFQRFFYRVDCVHQLIITDIRYFNFICIFSLVQNSFQCFRNSLKKTFYKIRKNSLKIFTSTCLALKWRYLISQPITSQNGCHVTKTMNRRRRPS